MTIATAPAPRPSADETATMRAAVLHAPGDTHRFALEDIAAAYDVFSNRRDGVLKVAIRPGGQR